MALTDARAPRAHSSTLPRWKALPVRACVRECALNKEQSTDASLPRAVCLDWWASSGLPVRYSKVALHHISKMGNIPLLDWWRAHQSRFALAYDKEVLVVATQHGQVAALEWWAASGLDIEYRFFEIEEALEDSVANKEETQKWWERRGYDNNLSTNAWMKVRNLNDRALPV